MKCARVSGLLLAGMVGAAVWACNSAPPGTAPTPQAQSEFVAPIENGNLNTGGTASFGPMAAAATTIPVDGWCSQTRYRCAETALQKNIVQRASAASGSSGRSIIGSPWLTDAAGGDGGRMLMAIQRYVNWTRARAPKASQADIERQMANDLAQTYNSTQQSQFVARIKARTVIYAPNFNGPLPGPPTTDQGALDYLGIQKQCKEWADSLVQAVGGRTFAYANSAAVSSTNARPGMGLYKLDSTHAALIIDIYWKNGIAYLFQLAEANMGSGWPQNPPGQVPWERTVRTDRQISLSGYKIVSFD
jgi:hypothetical protein